MKHINELFDNMDAWRHLPAYQLERRADIFFSIYLPDLLHHKFGVTVEAVLPEFPIRKGTIGPKSADNLSDKVDYLVKLREDQRVLFVELKTDDSSRRDRQDWYLEKAREVGFSKLLEGVREIYKATSSKKKYRYLLDCLQDMGFIALDSGVFRIIPADYAIQIVYIQPNNRESHENVISFQEAAQIVGQHEDEVSSRFAQSLLEWADTRAGEKQAGHHDR
jgi:hypothetical protein